MGTCLTGRGQATPGSAAALPSGGSLGPSVNASGFTHSLAPVQYCFLQCIYVYFYNVFLKAIRVFGLGRTFGVVSRAHVDRWTFLPGWGAVGVCDWSGTGRGSIFGSIVVALLSEQPGAISVPWSGLGSCGPHVAGCLLRLSRLTLIYSLLITFLKSLC